MLVGIGIGTYNTYRHNSFTFPFATTVRCTIFQSQPGIQSNQRPSAQHWVLDYSAFIINFAFTTFHFLPGQVITTRCFHRFSSMLDTLLGQSIQQQFHHYQTVLQAMGHHSLDTYWPRAVVDRLAVLWERFDSGKFNLKSAVKLFIS